MPNEPSFDVTAAHKYFAVNCFNSAWGLIEKKDRTAEDDEQMPRNIETDLIVAKQRNGPVGSMKIAFIPEYTKFENMAKGSDY